MYRLLLAARIGTVISFALAFFVLSPISGSSITAKHMAVSIILFTFFVEAVVSYKHPQLEKQIPPNALLAKILKLSVLNSPATSQGRKLVMAISVFILFIANLARMLGYYDHAAS